VASNLALSFADLGHRPLLIDADCRRGTLHGLLTASDKPGLTDYLVGQAAREQIVQRTAYPSLRLIACGTRMHRAPELLGSAAMLELLAELRSLYSVIIVDTPPLGAGSDALTMGILTGNVVLVLRTGTTDRELTHMKLELLDRLPVRLLGAILNDVPPRGVYRYYAYLPGYETREERPATL
jgi:capsular exopolysaccharide synthesis family protein